MNNSDVAINYLTAFCGNDVQGVGATLSDDFRLIGPLFEFESKRGYLDSLLNSLEKARFEIIEQLEAENMISVYYHYVKSSGVVTVSQLFWFRDSKITKTLLVFDPTSMT